MTTKLVLGFETYHVKFVPEDDPDPECLNAFVEHKHSTFYLSFLCFRVRFCKDPGCAQEKFCIKKKAKAAAQKYITCASKHYINKTKTCIVTKIHRF